MKQFLLLFTSIFTCTVYAQQINGVFTDFARNDIWGNTVINTATQQTTDYITLGGYYEGSQIPKKIPLALQISPSGVIRNDFGGNGAFLMSSVNSNGSSQADRIYIANSSTTANGNQLIVAGQYDAGDGFFVKTWPTGTRPTAFNNGNITRLFGGGATERGFIEDWVTGFNVYSVRLNGATFGNARVLLSTFNRNTGAPLVSFGDSGTVTINAPEGSLVDYARPVRIVPGTTGNFYIAFSTLPGSGIGTGIALCGVNGTTGKIDSTFGSNGFKTFSTGSRYYITSLCRNSDESITIGGYGDEGMQSVPSFTTFNINASLTITSFNYLLGQPNPGFGSKNIGATKAVINSEERIVFAYAHPINTNNQFRIAIASLTPFSGANTDLLPHVPWLGTGFVSAEPTCIIPMLNNAGFIVTGKATRADGTFAGVVLKYTMAGLLDASFANQGVLIINGRQGGSPWAAVTQLPNNKYLAVGRATFIPTDLQKKALHINRFNSDGSIDTSFGTNGTLYAFVSDYDRYATQVIPLANNKFLVGGNYYNYLNEPNVGTGTPGLRATVYKFNADGSPDNSFGPYNDGKYIFPGYTGLDFEKMQLINNEVYMGGNTSVTTEVGGRVIILKLSAEGINTGAYLAPFRSLHHFTFNEPTGNMYIGGGLNGSPRMICKVKPSVGSRAGLPDSSFGLNGVVRLPMINSSESAIINQIKLKPGGIFVVVNWASSYNGPATNGIYFSLISSGGILDTTLGTGGAKFLQIPGATSILAQEYQWVNNGNHLLIFGQAIVNAVTQGFVCKVDLNGDLDTTFGTNGVVWTNNSFAGNFGFDNNRNMIAIKNYGFFDGGALAKLQLPDDLYNRIKSGSWTGTIDNDWFKAGNWAEGVVPDAYTEVVITNGSVLIGAGMNAFAYSVRVLGGANLTMGTNSTLEITKNNP